MKTENKKKWFLLAALLCAANANADTLVWDTDPAGGIQAGSGTWDFNTTANWTLDGGANRINWTNNTDSASFQLTGVGTVSVGATQVGTSGLVFTGSTTTWELGAVGGTNSIQLGTGGITNTITSGSVLINAPLVLTGSQTWSSSRITTGTGTPGLQVNGPISSLSGTTNLTFNGHGLTNAAAATGSPRVLFSMGGTNTYSGSTTISGGAALRLDYGTNPGSKLDDSSALILSGGSLVLEGGTGIVEVVASTTITGGANSIYKGNNSGGTINRIQMGALTHGVGATFDISNATPNGFASTTSTNTTAGATGTLGGWATAGGNAWARAGAATVNGDFLVTPTSGAGRASSTAWNPTDNVNAQNAAGTTDNIVLPVGETIKTVNSLRIQNSNVTINLDTNTLQLTNGGIIAASTGQSITNGKIVSGMASGELFVHTPNAFTISSEIANNGSTAGILVKAGSNTLTLTGDNTYSGGTYVNSGTLAIASTGSLANGNVTVRGAATFTLDAASEIQFNIDGESAGEFDVFAQDEGGLFTLNGTLKLDFGSTFSSETWDLFTLASGTADGFTAINLTGAYTGSLSESGGIWTGTANGQTFQFNEANGILTVVPEPGVASSFLAGGLLLLSIRRRFRRGQI